MPALLQWQPTQTTLSQPLLGSVPSQLRIVVVVALLAHHLLHDVQVLLGKATQLLILQRLVLQCPENLVIGFMQVCTMSPGHCPPVSPVSCSGVHTCCFYVLLWCPCLLFWRPALVSLSTVMESYPGVQTSWSGDWYPCQLICCPRLLVWYPVLWCPYLMVWYPVLWCPHQLIWCPNVHAYWFENYTCWSSILCPGVHICWSHVLCRGAHACWSGVLASCIWLLTGSQSGILCSGVHAC